MRGLGSLTFALLAGCGVSACGKGCGASCPEGMVYVPAGTFQMGTDLELALSDERPVHQVTLSAFCMDRTEVTLDAYAECVKAGKCGEGGGTGLYGCGRLPEHSGRPMNCVTWDQAMQFCKARGARLPTEAEWEYAARGTDGRLYPWGNEPPDETRFRVGHEEPYCEGCPGKVGQFPKGASPFGVLDMVGNVKEWVADYYAPYSPEPQVSPLQTVPEYPQDPARVMRGGYGIVGKNGYKARVTQRRSFSARSTHTTWGFRCAQSLDP